MTNEKKHPSSWRPDIKGLETHGEEPGHRHDDTGEHRPEEEPSEKTKGTLPDEFFESKQPASPAPENSREIDTKNKALPRRVNPRIETPTEGDLPK